MIPAVGPEVYDCEQGVASASATSSNSTTPGKEIKNHSFDFRWYIFWTHPLSFFLSFLQCFCFVYGFFSCGLMQEFQSFVFTTNVFLFFWGVFFTCRLTQDFQKFVFTTSHHRYLAIPMPTSYFFLLLNITISKAVLHTAWRSQCYAATLLWLLAICTQCQIEKTIINNYIKTDII